MLSQLSLGEKSSLDRTRGQNDETGGSDKFRGTDRLLGAGVLLQNQSRALNSFFSRRLKALSPVFPLRLLVDSSGLSGRFFTLKSEGGDGGWKGKRTGHAERPRVRLFITSPHRCFAVD